MTDVTPLRNVLRCTSTFVPDVGYVQVCGFWYWLSAAAVTVGAFFYSRVHVCNEYW